MNRKIAIGLACALACGALSAAAQQGGEPQMTAEQQQAMEAMMKAMTPGPQHQHLARAVGEWDFLGKFWTEPGAPPQESKGASTRELMLGGRVLRERVTSNVMGMPFEGFGMTGFDNVTGRFWATWNDNMSTGVMLSYGTCDAEMKRCEFEGSYPDPLTGKMKKNRMVSEHHGDHEVMRSYEAGPDGKEVLTMELAFNRKKG